MNIKKNVFIYLAVLGLCWGMGIVPQSGIKLLLPAKGVYGLLATGPPGKSLDMNVFNIISMLCTHHMIFFFLEQHVSSKRETGKIKSFHLLFPLVAFLMYCLVLLFFKLCFHPTDYLKKKIVQIVDTAPQMSLPPQIT